MSTYQFPSVDDNEPIVGTPVIMNLYENEDLITNINGLYQDKDYSNPSHSIGQVDSLPNQRLAVDREKTINEGKSYAELAREKARRDVKEKRQNYLLNEVKKPSKATFKKDLQATAVEKASKYDNDFSRYGEKLKQEQYILAELPTIYQKANPEPKTNQKNNYDFLKRSQIYNKKENTAQKEHRIAQELNLTRFEDVN